jgi:hypothetical protein
MTEENRCTIVNGRRSGGSVAGLSRVDRWASRPLTAPLVIAADVAWFCSASPWVPGERFGQGWPGRPALASPARPTATTAAV